MQQAVCGDSITADVFDFPRSSVVTTVERVTSADYLRDQYGTTEKLQIRIEAHRRYSERPDDMLDWVLDRLAPQPGDSVVDIGCGPGGYHSRLVDRGARVILGLDTSPSMVAVAQHQANQHGYPVVAIQASAERLPLPDDCYDLGMANHVLSTLGTSRRRCASCDGS
jgi:SAM-dependent methyltransferase